MALALRFARCLRLRQVIEANSPLKTGETGEGVTQRFERWLLRRMSDSMQIESLWKYNAKFNPSWRARYAVYDAPEHMLPAALAVARAESWFELPVIGRFLTPDPVPAP